MGKFLFLSTLSLRRATSPTTNCFKSSLGFLSTLSLRRATFNACSAEPIHAFLSTLSLRRATFGLPATSLAHRDFYPRSPCGERQVSVIVPSGSLYFYPRSPCGERPSKNICLYRTTKFLSTLSLRRATNTHTYRVYCPSFLSTLSLRRATSDKWQFKRYINISIHALLAESDACTSNPLKASKKFLSTLSLRRATCQWRRSVKLFRQFLSTLSLRRATHLKGLWLWRK